LILLPVHTFKQRLSQARREPLKLLLSATVVVLVILHAMSVYAARTEFEQPDVLVLVMGGPGGYDQCAINYTTAVALPTAQADLNTIAKLGKWRVSNARGQTKPSGGPHSIPTTSITWQAVGIIGYSNGTLPLEPFVTALKRFKFIEVDYIAPASFQFRGLREFENRFVSVQLAQSGNPYRYRAVVKDKGFGKLDLPLTQPVKPRPEEERGMSTAARVGLALGLGIPAAIAVYLIALYLSKRR
jgi:hypothetical protein